MLGQTNPLSRINLEFNVEFRTDKKVNRLQ